MQTMQAPAADHAEFDAICSEVEEFEPLPAVTTTPSEQTYKTEEEQIQPVNELILAGLVSPY